MDSKPARIYEPLIVPAALDPDAVKICRRLKRYGHEAYLVGGCVRDLSLGHIPKDFDVATSARPRQIKRLFRNARIIGRRFKLVHIQFGEKIIEVSTFRKNPSVDAESALEAAEVEPDAIGDPDIESPGSTDDHGSRFEPRRDPHVVAERSEDPIADPEDGDADIEADIEADAGQVEPPARRSPLDDEPPRRRALDDEPRRESSDSRREWRRDREPTDARDDRDRERGNRRDGGRHPDQRGDRGARDFGPRATPSRHEGRFRDDRGRDDRDRDRARDDDRERPRNEPRGRHDPPRGRHDEPRGRHDESRGRHDEHRGGREASRDHRRGEPHRDPRRDDRAGDRHRMPPTDPRHHGSRDEDDRHGRGAQPGGPHRHGGRPENRRGDSTRRFDDERSGGSRNRTSRDDYGADRGRRDSAEGPRSDRSARPRDRQPDPFEDGRDDRPVDRHRGGEGRPIDRGERGASDHDRRRSGRDDWRDRDRGEDDVRRRDDPPARGEGRESFDRERDRPYDDRGSDQDERDDRDFDEGSDSMEREPDDGQGAEGSDRPDPSRRRRGGRGRRRHGGRGPGGSSRQQRSRRDRIHRGPDDDDAPDREEPLGSGPSEPTDDDLSTRGNDDRDPGDRPPHAHGSRSDLPPRDLDDPEDDADSEDDDDGSGDLLIRRDNVFGTAEEDAVRRDFTINALFYDVDENVVLDYVGGAEDLARRVIRTIGDPEIRFQEDPVRILRAIKFAARLNFTFDEATYAALVKYRGDLRKCAPPRLTEELLKILSCGAAARAFDLMRSSGVLETILPEIHDYIERDPDLSIPRARNADEPHPDRLDSNESHAHADDEEDEFDDEGTEDATGEIGSRELAGDEVEGADDSSATGMPRDEAGASVPRLTAAELIRRYLEVIDEADRGRRVFGNATLFCALLLGPIREAIAMPGVPRDPGMAADRVMRPFAQRMAISRRDAFRVKQIVVALPRFRRQKNSRRRRRVKPIDLVKRDYFKDALDFYRIECTVRGWNEVGEIRRWLDLYYGWLRNANPREWRRARTEAPFDDFEPSNERTRTESDASTPPGQDDPSIDERDGRDERLDSRGQGGRRRRRRGRGRHRDQEFETDADSTPSPGLGGEGEDGLDPPAGVGVPRESGETTEDEVRSNAGAAEDSEGGRGRRRRRGRGRDRGDRASQPAPEDAGLDTESEDDDPIVEIDWNAPFPKVDDPGPISMIRTGVDQTDKRSRRRRRRLDGAARELSKEVEDQPALQALKMIEGDPRGHEATRPRRTKRRDEDRGQKDRDPPFDFVADFESIEDVFRW